MGIRIELDVDFSKVEQEQWESVYRESLELLEYYPFMDNIVDEDSYSRAMVYTDRTKERYLSPWYPDIQGWYVIGDLDSYRHAESFMLVKDSTFYRYKKPDRETGDIYFSLIKWYNDADQEIQAVRTGGTRIFDSKTQGYDYHKYLLGIALLIEDRLKPHAVVSGDITRAQLRKSMGWVNECLERKISLPDRYSYTTLFSRVKKQLKREAAQIEGLINLLLYPENKELGDFIRNNFSHEAILEYWTKVLKNSAPGTIGMGRKIERYLHMQFCLEDLCNILVLKENGKCMTPEECMTAVLETGILTMMGYHDSTSLFQEESALKKVFYAVFKQKDAVDEVFAEFKKRTAKDDPGDLIEDIIEKSASSASKDEDPGSQEKYDIEKPADIIYWEEGDSLHPDLMEDLQRILYLIDTQQDDLKHDFSDKSKDARMDALLAGNSYFLIRKIVWNYILENIHDDGIFYRFLALLRIKADELYVNTLIRSVCNNLAFLQHYVLDHAVSVNS